MYYSKTLGYVMSGWNHEYGNPNNKERCVSVCLSVRLYGTDFSETYRPILTKLCMR